MEIYDDPKHFERSYIKHLKKYEKAKLTRDRHQLCMQYGAMGNMENVLRQKFGYTEKEIEALKNGQPSD